MESYTTFENHVYTSKTNLMIAINFVATPFLGGFFCYATQAKVCQNVVATPFLGGFFLMLHRQSLP